MNISSRKPAEAQPNRMGALAKLPVFFDLAGKRAVLAGGSPGATWKAELLAASGADVDLYTEDPSSEMLSLVERGAAAGSLRLNHRPWAIDVFHGAAIAVGDFEDEAEAKAFRCAARAAGVPVNTVDKPATCDFIFGSVVNRSPVVIGISTDGAAPILGQAVRRKIETLLPTSLTDWARLARDIREAVLSRLSVGPQRRAFWEAFADRAFGPAPAVGEINALSRVIDTIRCDARAGQGRVTLVGAGPGDPDLLTMRALRALQSADVILFDDLVSDGILELARREAKRMMVGKRGARESCSQADINTLMLKLAKQGKHVVRLKSGDPMIFGRAGEEIEALERAGIPVSIVPGITSAQGLAAGLGISLTHRDHAQKLTVMTGHSRKGEVPETIDWAKAADPHTTTVIYMGARTAQPISEALIAHGLDGLTPAVAVASISRPEEARWVGRLANLSEGVKTLPEGAPVLIGIGAVFGALTAAREAIEPDQLVRMLGA
jgi:uroporphyrin-III C-methyltransferase/precorrin-2 dehydrogenase/sirohydrochlorin ferrochelatase